jgi:hypothetical protein
LAQGAVSVEPVSISNFPASRIKEQGIAGVAVAQAIFASDSQLFQWLAGRIPEFPAQ